MLPTMATAKTKFVAFQRKFNFSERQEKSLSPHKIQSRVLARSQILGTV
jgi:hypothetical protein